MHSKGTTKNEVTLYKSKSDVSVSTIKKPIVSLAAEDWKLAPPTDTRKILTERSMATVKVKKVYITLSYLTGDSHVLQG